MAHPRSRGENLPRAPWPITFPGSSPLTRGKLRLRARSAGRRRLIPAHAGKTPCHSTSMSTPWAHPRSRGENHEKRPEQTRERGSSPLTRGKLVDAVAASVENGLIPAHAGKTGGQIPALAGFGAHPRSRGENAGRACRSPRPPGSSPLTRGKRPPGEWSRSRTGLIPAHAGKTPQLTLTPSAREAHPRSRGENQWRTPAYGRRVGSSPLTRGKRPEGPLGEAGGGLIPAHAGKTCRSLRERGGGRAHPRSRGENTYQRWGTPRCPGSSPLTRGKLQGPLRRGRQGGLIPAHAGKTRIAISAIR